MVEGRLRKYLAEITLIGQPFVKDDKLTVEKLLKQGKARASASIVRFEVGRGHREEAGRFRRRSHGDGEGERRRQALTIRRTPPRRGSL